MLRHKVSSIFTKVKSSVSVAPNPGPETPPSDNLKLRKHAAFRTITTMLALIQQEQPLQLLAYDTPKSLDVRRELKIYNAIATLCITDFQVVTVVANPGFQGLEVAVYIQTSADDDGFRPNGSSQSSSINCFSPFWKLIATNNYRRDDDKERATDTSRNEFRWIIPQAPTSFESTSPEDGDYLQKLKDYISKQRWWVWMQPK